MEWTLLGSTDMYGRLYLYATAFPASETVIMNFFRTTPPLHDTQIAIRSDGALRIRDTIGSNIFGSVPIALNQWIRIEYHILDVASPNGIIEVKLFNTAESPSANETIGGVGIESSATFYEHLQIGKSFYGTWTTDVWLDDIVANATSYPGPVIPPAPEVLSIQQHVGRHVW